MPLLAAQATLGAATCRFQVEALALEKRQLESRLAGAVSSERVLRDRAEDAEARGMRSRQEAVGYVQEVQAQLAANAALQRDNAMLLEQVAAAEQAIQVHRGRAGGVCNARQKSAMDDGMMHLLTAPQA